MIQIGRDRESGKREEDLSGLEEDIYELFRKVVFETDSKVYEVDVRDLLSMPREPSKDFTDTEIMLHLEKCSRWRYTFGRACEYTRKVLTGLEEDYREWLAQASDTAEKAILEDRKGQVTESLRSGVGQVTSQQILDRVMITADLRNERRVRLDKIAEMKERKATLNLIFEVLHERGFHLMAMAKIRLAERSFSNLD